MKKSEINTLVKALLEKKLVKFEKRLAKLEAKLVKTKVERKPRAKKQISETSAEVIDMPLKKTRGRKKKVA